MLKEKRRIQIMEKSNTDILISEEKFEKLAKHNDFYCISLYIPLEKNETRLYGKEILKKHIDRLTHLLAAENIKGQEASNYLTPIKQLLNRDNLWYDSEDKQAKTLVIFANENSIYHFKINSFVSSYIYLTSNFYLLPLFKKIPQDKILKAVEKINSDETDDQLIVNRVEKIIPLAFEGKIDTLYVSSSNGIYGIYDSDNKTTMIDEERGNTNMSLLNLAAMQTYLNNGKVCLIEPDKMPIKGIPIQAIIKEDYGLGNSVNQYR